MTGRTIRAHVNSSYGFQSATLAVRIALVDTNDQGVPINTVAVLQFKTDDAYPTWRYLTDEDQGGPISDRIDSTILNLPEGVPEALLEGLSRHLHGGADAHVLRQDLLHERKRRDIAEDRLSAVLSQLADVYTRLGITPAR